MADKPDGGVRAAVGWPSLIWAIGKRNIAVGGFECTGNPQSQVGNSELRARIARC